MTVPTSSLDWYKQSAPRGVMDMHTGYTLTPTGSTGFTFAAYASETDFVDKVVVTWTSGVTFSSVLIRIPSFDITEAQNRSFTKEQFEIMCGGGIELDGVRTTNLTKFFPESGSTYYQFVLDFKPALVVKSSNNDWMRIKFAGFTAGTIHMQPVIWRILEANDGI